MPRINLLPWRAEQRKERQKNFAVASIAAVLLGALIMLLVNIYLQGRIDYQKARNQRLEQEIARLDNQIKEIRDLRLRKERLLARMAAIDDLQRARPEAVYLFDQLVAVMPEGVYLTEFTQNGRNLLFRGVAESSTRVSALMRNIAGSPYLGNPVLEVVQSGQEQRGETQPAIGRRAQFALAAQQLSTTDEGGE
ncbi:PilN domain-containing protein [Thioalkalivibrio sp. XN8]|uniref:PilN domain-containing protein n=1 Tax=Thioalkalivibrio sp. XN8 TaxID=2712863 RepID=UPI0013EAFC80|nr:PilN domain-containing protein [Thioalkalivibrio sp. XN8]NGP52395.1 pilus assembly protein PilN [Thioalkalivibrio sp. XN8]